MTMVAKNIDHHGGLFGIISEPCIADSHSMME